MTQPEPAPKPRRRRWLRRLFVAALFAATALAFRAPLLRNAGSILVADDGLGRSNRVVILGGDRRFDVAAELVTAGDADGILLLAAAARRVADIGVIPSGESIARRELGRRGIPADRIEVVPGAARTAWEYARQLGMWLTAHPDATVLVLTDRLTSRHDRLVFRRILADDQMARVRVAALPHRDYSETDWWQAKGGELAFGYGALGLGYTFVVGEGSGPSDSPTADELESRVP